MAMPSSVTITDRPSTGTHSGRPPEKLPPAGDFGFFMPPDRVEFFVRELHHPGDVRVDDDMAVFGNGPQGQLRLPGRRQLAGKHDVEIRIESPGDHGRDHDSAPGNPQNDRFGQIDSRKSGRELAPGIGCISKAQIVNLPPGWSAST